MTIISFAKKQSCEFEKEKIPRWYSRKLWHKKYDSIVQHAMVVLIQMVEGDF
jgi:hypothetical protein